MFNKKTVLRVIFSAISIALSLVLTIGISDVNMSSQARKLHSDKKIRFVDEDNNAVFRIVRPKKDASELVVTSGNVYRAYREFYNAKPENITDAEGGDDKREILIGDCDRESTRKAKELLKKEGSQRDCDYIICSVDNDIVIYSEGSKTLKSAVDIFIESFLKKENPNGIYHMYTGENHDYIEMGGTTECSRFTIVRPIYNVSYLTQSETEKLCDVLLKKTGCEVDIVNDNISEDNPEPDGLGGVLKQTPVNDYEIIVGNCNRDNVNIIEEKYKYEIRIEGKKIYLNGGSAHATAMAVSEFIKIVEQNDRITDSMSVLDGNYGEAIKSYDTATYYRPVWGDDFDTQYIDIGTWKIGYNKRNGTAADGKPCYRTSRELNNNYIKDGKLVLEAVKTDTAYYGGVLDTGRSMEFKYGYLEFSDIHCKGDSFWTAVWTVSKSSRYNKDMWYSETDIDEDFGGGYEIKGNLWAWPTPYGQKKLGIVSSHSTAIGNLEDYQTSDPRGLWQDYHTYGLLWLDNEHIKFTIDGNVWREATLERDELKTAYSQFMYVIISMSTANGARGVVTSDEWEWQNTNKFMLDWIYLYQVDGNEIMLY